MIFVEMIIALVLYSVMSLNLAISTDNYETNKYQRLRDSVDWTYLRNWVLQGPWDIDERHSALLYVLRFFVEPIIIRTDSSFAPKTIA